MDNDNFAAAAWTLVLRRRLARTTMMSPLQSRYGVHVPFVLDRGRHVIVDFVFFQGERYCCLELGCHMSFRAAAWRAMRTALAVERYVAEEHGPIVLGVHVVVEDGALWLCDVGDHRQDHRFALSAPFRYCVNEREPLAAWPRRSSIHVVPALGPDGERDERDHAADEIDVLAEHEHRGDRERGEQRRHPQAAVL